MDATDPVSTELRERLDRYPADRYPVQHATARFHLGVSLLQQDLVDDAIHELRAASELFGEGLPIERAKALNALGAALRDRGRAQEAADLFAAAADAFAAAAERREHGAALFNLGLASRDAGDEAEAADAFLESLGIFEDERLVHQAAAAARELGATLLALGELDDAVVALGGAMELAERAGDLAGLGVAANVLGLVHLAAERPDAAVDALTASVGANPRSVRPAAYAMAKGNLALAHEHRGDAARARLAAKQALGTPGAPGAVMEQVRDLLARVPGDGSDLLTVLDGEEPGNWAPHLRDELLRWGDAATEERRASVAAWIDGQLERRERGLDLAEAWLGALLELPPGDMEALIAAAIQTLRDRQPEERERFRRVTSRAMAHFHAPQLLRLQDTFNRLAVELGEEPAW